MKYFVLLSVQPLLLLGWAGGCRRTRYGSGAYLVTNDSQMRPSNVTTKETMNSTQGTELIVPGAAALCLA